MGSLLQIHRRTEGGTTQVTIAGDMTEASAFEPLQGLSGRVVIDLSGIRRLNSLGVRQWLQFVEGVDSSADLFFEKCPSAIIAQLNMITNFLGRGKIVSVVAPYVCLSCNASEEFLLEIEKEFAKGERVAPSRPCVKCQKVMGLDDLDESYFAFLGPSGN